MQAAAAEGAAAGVAALAAVGQHQQEQQQPTRRLKLARVRSQPPVHVQVAWPPTAAAACPVSSQKLLVQVMGQMMVEEAPQVEVLRRVVEVARQVDVARRRGRTAVNPWDPIGGMRLVIVMCRSSSLTAGAQVQMDGTAHLCQLGSSCRNSISGKSGWATTRGWTSTSRGISHCSKRCTVVCRRSVWRTLRTTSGTKHRIGGTPSISRTARGSRRRTFARARGVRCEWCRW